MSKRIARLNEQLKREISALVRTQVRDPRVGLVTVTNVEVAADLGSARVRVRVMGTDADRVESLAGLDAAAPFLRHSLGQILSIRHIPELRFMEDHSLDHALRIEQIKTPRPMTHDLLHDLLGKLNVIVEKIVVNDLKDNTYFARIHLLINGDPQVLDSRPSDAIALALRAEAPIFVEQSVLEQTRTIDDSGEITDSERLRQWFENLDPEDFSKYEM